MKNMKKYKELYKEELFNNVIPFWEKHSIDTEYGGYFSCLDKNGNVYDTDKHYHTFAHKTPPHFFI